MGLGERVLAFPTLAPDSFNCLNDIEISPPLFALDQVLLAAALIVTASWQLASYRPFREAVAALPMWVLLMVISIYIFIHGLFF